MRRITTVGVSLVLALGLTNACKKKDKEAPAPKVTAPAPTPEPEKKELTQADVLKIFDDCWAAFDAKDTEKFKDCYAAEGTIRIVDSVPPMEAKGPEAIAQLAGQFQTAFPDLKHTVKLVVVNGKQVAAFLHAEGTNAGSFMGMPATNKKISMMVAQVAELDEDGKIVRDDHYYDGGTMMAQLGISPNPMAPAIADVNAPAETARVEAKDDETETANLAALQALEEPMKKRDVAAMMAGYADDAVFRYVADKKIVKGKAAIEKGLKEWLGMSKDMTVEISNAFAAGDWVIAETSSSGTIDKNIPKLPVKTKGKKFEQKYLEFVRLADGKIKEHWIFSNGTKWAADMGLFDPSKMGGGEAPKGGKAPKKGAPPPPK